MHYEGCVSPTKKILTLIGAVSSLSFLGLLLIPGAPGQLATPSWIALIVWSLLGAILFAMSEAAGDLDDGVQHRRSRSRLREDAAGGGGQARRVGRVVLRDGGAIGDRDEGDGSEPGRLGDEARERPAQIGDGGLRRGLVVDQHGNRHR